MACLSRGSNPFLTSRTLSLKAIANPCASSATERCKREYCVHSKGRAARFTTTWETWAERSTQDEIGKTQNTR
eukprot:scaffold282979_cov32-Tisochrysis_lutea.AAC.3